MKKIICMLAMALLAIGAAQAQEQVRKMVIQKTNGQVMKCKTAEIETVTFEEVAVPTTVEEAEAMLVGYWKCNNPFLSFVLEDINYFESTAFLIVTEDLEILLGYKTVDYLPNEYAGKILVYESLGNDIIVNSDDPTMGDFFRYDYDTEGTALSFMNLDQNSFDAHFESYVEDGPTYIQDGTFYRVEPFEYIIVE